MTGHCGKESLGRRDSRRMRLKLVKFVGFIQQTGVSVPQSQLIKLK